MQLIEQDATGFWIAGCPVRYEEEPTMPHRGTETNFDTMFRLFYFPAFLGAVSPLWRQRYAHVALAFALANQPAPHLLRPARL